MSVPRVLSPHECLQLIDAGGVGRVALWAPTGPEIFPVNFVIHDGCDHLPNQSLQHAWARTAGEPRSPSKSTRSFLRSSEGWSVVAHGRATMTIDDALRQRLIENEPRPWAGGYRPTYVRLQWDRISGRAVEGAPRTCDQQTGIWPESSGPSHLIDGPSADQDEVGTAEEAPCCSRSTT